LLCLVGDQQDAVNVTVHPSRGDSDKASKKTVVDQGDVLEDTRNSDSVQPVTANDQADENDKKEVDELDNDDSKLKNTDGGTLNCVNRA